MRGFLLSETIVLTSGMLARYRKYAWGGSLFKEQRYHKY